MIPWKLLDTATVPDGGGQLRLMQRGAEFSIMAGPTELMNSRLSGLERALADLAFALIADRPRPDVLIGGLGMGFTLRAALTARPEATITVAELVPAVAAWARGPLAGVLGSSLDDPHVLLEIADVARLARTPPPTMPFYSMSTMAQKGLTRRGNEDLLARRLARRAHRPTAPAASLPSGRRTPAQSSARRLVTAGFTVEDVPVRAWAVAAGVANDLAGETAGLAAAGLPRRITAVALSLAFGFLAHQAIGFLASGSAAARSASSLARAASAAARSASSFFACSRSSRRASRSAAAAAWPRSASVGLGTD